jgi:hypothetical protein
LFIIITKSQKIPNHVSSNNGYNAPAKPQMATNASAKPQDIARIKRKEYIRVLLEGA